MKKITIIITAILLTSCGSVKKSSTETEIKKDSSSGSQKEWSLKKGNYSLKPFDPNKPMIFTNAQGKRDTLVNTIIEHHYNTEYVKVKDTTNVKDNFKQEQTTKEVDYSKLIDSAFKYLLYLVLIILFAMWLYKSLNPIELLKKLFKNQTPRI